MADQGISSMVYYPIALSDQQAYAAMIERVPIANSRLCDEVLSLPMTHPWTIDVLMICSSIKQYFAA